MHEIYKNPPREETYKNPHLSIISTNPNYISIELQTANIKPVKYTFQNYRVVVHNSKAYKAIIIEFEEKGLRKATFTHDNTFGKNEYSFELDLYSFTYIKCSNNNIISYTLDID